MQEHLEKADLTGCHVYGPSAWHVDLAMATQAGLVITPEGVLPVRQYPDTPASTARTTILVLPAEAKLERAQDHETGSAGDFDARNTLTCLLYG